MDSTPPAKSGARLGGQRARMECSGRRGIAPFLIVGGLTLTGGVIALSLALLGPPQDVGVALAADPWARVAVGIQFVMSVFMVGMAWAQVRASMKTQDELKRTLTAIQEQQHRDNETLARHDERLNHLEGT